LRRVVGENLREGTRDPTREGSVLGGERSFGGKNRSLERNKKPQFRRGKRFKSPIHNLQTQSTGRGGGGRGEGDLGKDTHFSGIEEKFHKKPKGCLNRRMVSGQISCTCGYKGEGGE